jgi:8-oxo-dGTP pyrophosphatase MutT (NUDIX family)
MRETWEEANARVELTGLFSLFSIPHISQVYMLFTGKIVDGKFSPGIESLECRLFSRNEIPWEQLAFKVVEETLRRYYLAIEGNSVNQLQIDNILKPTARN